MKWLGKTDQKRELGWENLATQMAIASCAITGWRHHNAFIHEFFYLGL